MCITDIACRTSFADFQSHVESAISQFPVSSLLPATTTYLAHAIALELQGGNHRVCPD